MLTPNVTWLKRMYYPLENDVVGQLPADATTGEEWATNEAPPEDPDPEEESDEDEDPDPEEKSDEDEDEAEDGPTETQDSDNEEGYKTRSGRTSKPRKFLMHEQKLINVEQVEEIMAVGADIGGGFLHTSKLAPMKYKVKYKVKMKMPMKYCTDETIVSKNEKNVSDHNNKCETTVSGNEQDVSDAHNEECE